MLDPSDKPRVFGLPLGVDFPAALIEGLTNRMVGETPEALARVQLIVNTRRMARRIRALFDEGPARLLPRIQVITDLGEYWDLAHIPEAVPPLRRRLELIELISSLLNRQPDLAARASLYDLADSLAALMDEMHGEGVSPDAIEKLDVADQSGHWDRIKTFLGIVRHFFDTTSTRPDIETRQRLIIDHLTETWRLAPPSHPIIVAGSTGSRGATQKLMQAVARLPQGAVVLPGYDFDMAEETWGSLDDAMLSEDHPQYRFHLFAQKLGLTSGDIAPWTAARPANAARNEVVSLALRPAPVTDQWLDEGPKLQNIEKAMQDVTLVEAQSTRQEALAIALRLRKAHEDGQTAALITPDRALTRQVTAALSKWDILPDDSAGIPLQLTAPGRFLRHVADLAQSRLTAEALLTLLKHPLAHSGADRGPHLLLTRELELHLRREGPLFPEASDIAHWAAGRKEQIALAWSDWVCKCFTGRQDQTELPLPDRVNAHVRLAERIAGGSRSDGSGELWSYAAGRESLAAVEELQREAEYGGSINAADYRDMFGAILSRRELRERDLPHPHILIWGTLEARVQGAELLILAGLNEGSWPEPPKPDPWLNRALRNQAGLLLPERRIGLSAHDFQQAISAKEVWLTRSVRSDEAETVASRWLNRIQNLLGGLVEQNGAKALDEMRKRGQGWLQLVAVFEDPGHTDPATRPAPCPPLAARPRQLSVTEIKRLIRDPYAIYCKHVLRLRPLDPLMRAPDALLRGIVLHDVLDQFVQRTRDNISYCTPDTLLDLAQLVLADNVPWAETRAIWLARLHKVADWFVESELNRRELATPCEFETKGTLRITDLGFTLTAKADRIDMDDQGNLHIYDYKTGAPPSKDEQRYFDKQLLLEAVIAEQAGFGQLAPSRVARAVYIGLGGGGKEVAAPLENTPTEKTRAEFEELIRAYLDRDRGFVSRRALHKKTDNGEYDQLARFGEWDIIDPYQKVILP